MLYAKDLGCSAPGCDVGAYHCEVHHITDYTTCHTTGIDNLTLACEPCNHRKGNRPVEVFLKKKPEVLERIRRQAKAPLSDATAVNATRWELYRRLQATGVPVDSYGVGSTLIRGENDFTADVVIVDGVPCAKVGRRFRPNPRLQPVE